MRALIVVDIQNDFLPGGALPVPEGDAVVAAANRLQDSFELIVATQDWHPANHGSFALNHAGKKPGDLIQLGGQPQVLWPVHCVQYTPGADFAPGLRRGRFRKVFQKGVQPDLDSYSGFFDNGRCRATGLDQFLHHQQVEEVYVVGLATDYCVKFTALDAAALGFRTYVVADACRGVDLQPGDVAAALDQMRRAGVGLVNSQQVCAHTR